MQQIPTRRDFLKTIGALGVAAAAGCVVPQQNTASTLESLLAEVDKFGNVQLGFEELKQAAKYTIQLTDYKGTDIKGHEKDVEKARSRMQEIVHYGLNKGEGNVYVCLNLRRDEKNGTASKGRELITNVTTRVLADDLNSKAGKHKYFSQRDVLELVANSAQQYERMPEKVISAEDVKQRGFKILRSTDDIGRMLGAGDFVDVRCGESFTKENHQSYAGKQGNDYKQGVYFKEMPAAVKLVIAKTPVYAKAVEK